MVTPVLYSAHCPAEPWWAGAGPCAPPCTTYVIPSSNTFSPTVHKALFIASDDDGYMTLAAEVVIVVQRTKARVAMTATKATHALGHNENIELHSRAS